KCDGDAQNFGGPSCQEVRGLRLDTEIERLALAALEPDRIALALEALNQLELEMKALNRQWELRLERARYEALRAQRQYDAVDPLCGLPGYVASGFYPQPTASIRFIQTPHNSMH